MDEMGKGGEWKVKHSALNIFPFVRGCRWSLQGDGGGPSTFFTNVTFMPERDDIYINIYVFMCSYEYIGYC